MIAKRMYYVIHAVSDGLLFGRFDGRWTATRDLAYAALFESAGEAENARQALLQEARDRRDDPEFWRPILGGLVVVAGVERTLRLVPANEDHPPIYADEKGDWTVADHGSGARIQAAERRAEHAEADLAARDRAVNEMLGLTGPWPIVSILRRLADAADHFLQVHDCDHHGWEGVGIARDEARKRADALDALLSRSASPSMDQV